MVFPMNCYLVIEDDGLTLVDSTMSSPADDLAAIVKQLGKELRRVALTHAHGDHVGGVSGVRKLFPDVRSRSRIATPPSWPATRPWSPASRRRSLRAISSKSIGSPIAC